MSWAQQRLQLISSEPYSDRQARGGSRSAIQYFDYHILKLPAYCVQSLLVKLQQLASECRLLLVVPVSCGGHHSLLLIVNPFGTGSSNSSCILHLDSTGESLWHSNIKT